MKAVLLALMIGLNAGLSAQAPDYATARLRAMEIATEESDMCLAASRVPGKLVIAAEAWCSDPKTLEGECVVRFLGEEGGAAYRMKKDKAKGWRVVESVSFNRNQAVIRMSSLTALRAISHIHVPAPN